MLAGVLKGGRFSIEKSGVFAIHQFCKILPQLSVGETNWHNKSYIAYNETDRTVLNHENDFSLHAKTQNKAYKKKNILFSSIGYPNP